MGGYVCMVHRNAVLKFTSVPTQPVQQAQFDEQIRHLYTLIAQDVVNDTDQVETVCNILIKPSFTMEDRTKLLDVVESLYEPYPT